MPSIFYHDYCLANYIYTIMSHVDNINYKYLDNL